MIRNPLHSAAGRTRPDINRVAEGIAASLRAFSTAQQLATPQDDNDGDGDGGRDWQRTPRQRSLSALSDLMQLNNDRGFSSPPSRSSFAAEGSSSSSSSSSPTSFRTLDLRASAAGTPNSTSTSPTLRRGPLPMGTNNQIGLPGAPRTPGSSLGSNDFVRAPIGGPNVIRGLPGGFRGRGGSFGFGRGGRGGGDMMGRGGGGFGRGGSGGRGGRGGRGQGRGRGSNNEGGRGGKRGGGEGGSNERGMSVDSPAVLAMREARETGSLHQFDPTISRTDLTGWGPAVPTVNSTAGNEETVLRQVRILGGGQMFHPTHIMPSDVLWKDYTGGTGVFFPTPEVKAWSISRMGAKKKKKMLAPLPQETNDAILQDALLGTYRGPEYADTTNTLDIVQNYVRKDATWNADAQRRIHAKIQSLLPGGKPTPPITRNPEANRAEA